MYTAVHVTSAFTHVPVSIWGIAQYEQQTHPIKPMSNRANPLPATAPSYEKCLRWKQLSMSREQTRLSWGAQKELKRGRTTFYPQTNPGFRLPQVALDHDRLQAVWGRAYKLLRSWLSYPGLAQLCQWLIILHKQVNSTVPRENLFKLPSQMTIFPCNDPNGSGCQAAG